MHIRLIITTEKAENMDHLFVLIPLLLGILGSGKATPLDDYVNKPDPTYKYTILSKHKGVGYTLYTINMTSQTWKPTQTSQPIWWHYLSVTIPDKVDKDSGFMLIDGGSNRGDPPKSTDNFVALTIMFAVTTNSIGACLKQIPNEPIKFKRVRTVCVIRTAANYEYTGPWGQLNKHFQHKIDDPSHKSRGEDAIIAWTWKSFVDNNGSDPEILLRLPMTKAAVRGMDTIQAVAKKMENVTVNRFLVSGASKRGWATWTTAAVDKRVIGLAPMVMDLLSIVANVHHYYRSLGGWTFAFKDYYELNFTQQLDNPATQMMADVIDPLVYKDRYKNKPIFVIQTGGDEFFMVDDSKFYYDQLPGDNNYLRMTPNAEHSLAGHEISTMWAIRAFYLSIVAGKPLPKMNWTMEYLPNGGQITLDCKDQEPATVDVYYATTLDGKRKDFRLLRGTPGDPSKPEVHPVFWLKKEAKYMGNNTFVAECSNPDEGWTAFFIQVTFPGLDGSTLEFTTQTLITPNTYPFPDCHGESCQGNLV